MDAGDKRPTEIRSRSYLSRSLASLAEWSFYARNNFFRYDVRFTRTPSTLARVKIIS